MKPKIIFTAILLFLPMQASSNQSVFSYSSESVTVEMSKDETIHQAVQRAKQILSINAVTKTPKFVSLKTSFDSQRDEIIETGLIAQGADISITNVKHSVRTTGKLLLIDVVGDVRVDISAMLEKLHSEKREKLMQSMIDDMHKEQKQIEGVLNKIKNLNAITAHDSQLINEYNQYVNRSFNMLPGNEIMQVINADKNGTSDRVKKKKQIIKAYEQFVFPFIKNAGVKVEIVDITELKHAVAEIKVRVTIDRTAQKDGVIPRIKDGLRIEDCEVFFAHCNWLLDIEQSPFFVDGQPTGNWSVHEVLEPLFCGRSIYEFLPVTDQGAWGKHKVEERIKCGRSDDWTKGALRELRYPEREDSSFTKLNLGPDIAFKETDESLSIHERNIEIYNSALRELSNRAFWLRVQIGRESFHINLSHVFIEELTFSAYQPISWIADGIKIKSSVREEQYNSNNLSWSDMSRKLLRYQDRKIKFY